MLCELYLATYLGHFIWVGVFCVHPKYCTSSVMWNLALILEIAVLDFILSLPLQTPYQLWSPCEPSVNPVASQTLSNLSLSATL